ncbi:MAG: hypothetical protein K9M99_02820 [Candidatus Cloacimonetes bacterium]|nr:hypothetical protein [Candidatus Cloacimonadota bacterium]
MPVLPMSVEKILEVCNLPQQMKVNALWVSMHQAAIVQAGEYVTDEYLADLTGEAVIDAAKQTLGEIGFGLYTYNLMMSVMNLHTIGKGFVQKTGIEDNATELLKITDVNSYRKSLRQQSLETLKAYLNEYGKQELKRLQGRHGLGVSMITAPVDE